MQGLHDQSGLLLAALVHGADLGAVFAAGAIQHGNLHAVLIALQALADSLLGLKGLRRFLGGLLVQQIGADAGVRADHGAIAALDAAVHVPLGNHHGNAALLILGGAGGHAAGRIQLGHGQLVALLGQNGLDEGLEVGIVGHLHGHGALGGGFPLLGHGDLHQAGDGDVDGVPVLLDDLVALLAVGLLGVGLHVLIRLVIGDDVGQLEERSLHDGVDAAAHADFLGQLDGVDGVELGVLLRQQLLHGSGQLLLHLLGRPGAVEQEGAAVLQRGHHVILGDIGRLES